MQSLVSQVNLINDQLIGGIRDNYKSFGLTRSTKVLTESQNFEVSSGERVFIDDTFKSFFYHKINGDISYNKIKSPGKTNVYNAIASINLVCYSEFIDFQDHILNRLGKVKRLTIKSLNTDSSKIIKEETGKGEFDFNKYLFVVSYQILYKTDNCYELCQ